MFGLTISRVDLVDMVISSENWVHYGYVRNSPKVYTPFLNSINLSKDCHVQLLSSSAAEAEDSCRTNGSRDNQHAVK